MAVTIVSQPTTYSPAYNNLVYNLTSDTTNVVKYQMLLTLYIDNVLIDTITLEKSAMPDGTAYFEISKIVANYLSKDFTGFFAEFMTNDNSFVRVTASFRDYGTTFSGYTDAVDTLCWNSVVDTLGWLSYNKNNYLLSSGNILSNHLTNNVDLLENASLYFIVDDYGTSRGATKITNGTFATDTAWTHPSEWVLALLGVAGATCDAAADNSTYIMYQATSGTVANTWYSFDITITSLQEGASISLDFGDSNETYYSAGTYKFIGKANGTNEIIYIAFMSALAGDTCAISSINCKIFDVVPYSLEVKTYTSSNTLIGTKIVANDKIGSLDKYRFLRIPSGAYNLNQISGSLITTGAQPLIEDNTDHYTLRIKGSDGTYHSTTTYTVVDNCSKYDSYRIHWLNRNGGYDSFTFNLVSKRNQDITRKFYKKQLGAVSYNSYDRQDTQYATKYKDRYLVTSNWISETESSWLSELFTSPDVYWDRGLEQSVAININQSSYEIKKIAVEKIFNIQFEFSLSFDEKTQGL